MNASGAGLAVAERPLPHAADTAATPPVEAVFGGEWIEMAERSDPISAGLKKLFETVADEAIPDDFLNLLDRIDAERAAQADASAAEKLQ